MTVPEPASEGGLHIDWRVVGRATLSGLSLIVPIVIITEILDATIDNFSDSWWVFFPFLLILFAYAASGYAGGRLAPWAPYTHGILAALGAFGSWLVIRVVERLVRGEHIGFGPRAVMTNVNAAVPMPAKSARATASGMNVNGAESSSAGSG